MLLLGYRWNSYKCSVNLDTLHIGMHVTHLISFMQPRILLTLDIYLNLAPHVKIIVMLLIKIRALHTHISIMNLMIQMQNVII